MSILSMDDFVLIESNYKLEFATDIANAGIKCSIECCNVLKYDSVTNKNILTCLKCGYYIPASRAKIIIEKGWTKIDNSEYKHDLLCSSFITCEILSGKKIWQCIDCGYYKLESA